MKLKDLLWAVICWTIMWGMAILVILYKRDEPVLPAFCMWVGGITFAEMTWICDFALPYLCEKWREKIARHRAKRPSGAADCLVSSLEAYHRVEDYGAAVDKLFQERTSGKIRPMPGAESPTEDTEDTENGKEKGQ